MGMLSPSLHLTFAGSHRATYKGTTDGSTWEIITMCIIYHIVMDKRTMVFSLTEVLIAEKIPLST